MSTGGPAVEGAGRTSALAVTSESSCARGGTATELGSGRGCVCLELPGGCLGRGSLGLGSRGRGSFPKAALCSDSPVTVETGTPNWLFQCISPFPGRASPCHSPCPPPPPRPARVGPAVREAGLWRRPGIPGVCLHVHSGEDAWSRGSPLSQEPEVRGHSVLSGRPGSFLLCSSDW